MIVRSFHWSWQYKKAAGSTVHISLQVLSLCTVVVKNIESSQKLSAGVVTMKPETLLTWKDSSSAKSSFTLGVHHLKLIYFLCLHVCVCVCSHEVKATAGVHWADTVCVHTHCDACVELFHISCEKAISPWQEAHRTACGAAYLHVSADNESSSERRTRRSIFQTAEWSRTHKSSNVYQHGKSNYIGWRELEKKCGETGEKNRAN